ncbi:unnamed protein product [Meganyctiphanes norvegica]|uniref:RFX-type winged-helix domain-containing protein n=1 Tax=Meganyctiphanes norvegica TaxID=48144 RepID=A0AAV2Q546_MEGNR
MSADSPTRAGSTSPCGSLGEMSIPGATTAHITAQVIVASSNGGSATSCSTNSSTSTTLVKSTANAASNLVTTEPPHIITVAAVSDGEGGSVESGGGSVPGGTYVQYVDTGGDHDNLPYTHDNGQMAYPVYSVGDTTMYTAATTYYQPGSTTPVSYAQDVANSPISGQILTGGGSSYLIQQGVDGESHPIINTTRTSPQTDGGVTYMVSGSGGAPGTAVLDADAQATLAHATRVSPATVQWLMDNYETAEGVSLPRSTLYNHYLRHCADHKLDPVNAASFGKLIRSVFIGLRTRRLGTRGNSKYHYYGIRVKPTSPLNNLSDDGSPVSLRHGGNGHNTSSQCKKTSHMGAQVGQQGKGVSSSSGQNKADGHYDPHSQYPSEASPQTLQQQQYLGDISGAVPMVDDLDFGPIPLPPGVSRNHLHTFTVLYREHSETILEAVFSLQFSVVENLWKRFWMINNNNNVGSGSKNSSNEMSDDDDGDLASLLPPSVLQALLQAPPCLEFIRNFDYQFYQNLVEVLIPDVLRSIPSSLTQSIRNFAKSLESWLSNAMSGCPSEVVQIKVSAVASLAQTLRRYTSLNHLAQAARAVLQNSSQIAQMLADLNRVDFHNVQEQASWVCQCDGDLVERLQEDFKATLQQQNSLEQWAEWLQTVVAQVLRPHQGKPDFHKHARQFLLKWSFYSSMVIRDLTLRSAASFGSFHLIRLLYDEYMFYLVEHRVASACGLTPIAVISQFLSGSGKLDMDGSSSLLNGDLGLGHPQDHDSVVPPFKRVKYETS